MHIYKGKYMSTTDNTSNKIRREQQKNGQMESHV